MNEQLTRLAGAIKECRSALHGACGADCMDGYVYFFPDDVRWGCRHCDEPHAHRWTCGAPIDQCRQCRGRGWVPSRDFWDWLTVTMHLPAFVYFGRDSIEIFMSNDAICRWMTFTDSLTARELQRAFFATLESVVLDRGGTLGNA